MLVSRLEVSQLRYTVAEAKSLSDAVAKFNERPAMRVDFMPEGEMLMGEGKWREGMDRLRKDADQDPPRVGPLLRYGTALLNAGLRDDAIIVFRNATRADPKSPIAYISLTNAYRFDPLGRITGLASILKRRMPQYKGLSRSPPTTNDRSWSGQFSKSSTGSASGSRTRYASGKRLNSWRESPRIPRNSMT